MKETPELTQEEVKDTIMSLLTEIRAYILSDYEVQAVASLEFLQDFIRDNLDPGKHKEKNV